MEKNKYIVTILIIVIISLGVYDSLHAVEMNMDLTIQVMRQAEEPFFYGNSLILTYADERSPRVVGAIFDHEGYKTLHPYRINKYNIYCLIYPIPADTSELKYRIVVDGLVLSDPANPVSETNARGVTFSKVAVPDNFIRKLIINPELKPGGLVSFTYTALPGKIVSLSGDFNMWDPYIDLFTETSPGTYTITRRIAAGEHYYFFFVNGEKRLDPFNKRRMVSTIGEEVNGFVVNSQF
jgi:hypothetical protein